MDALDCVEGDMDKMTLSIEEPYLLLFQELAGLNVARQRLGAKSANHTPREGLVLATEGPSAVLKC